MLYVVCCIHNSSLGRTFQVENEEAGIAAIKEIAENQFERQLNEEEIEDLKNNLEIYNDEDADNVYCWAIGIVEPK